MIGLTPILLFLALFLVVGMKAREFDGRVRQRLLLSIAVLIGLLFAAGMR